MLALLALGFAALGQDTCLADCEGEECADCANISPAAERCRSLARSGACVTQTKNMLKQCARACAVRGLFDPLMATEDAKQRKRLPKTIQALIEAGADVNQSEAEHGATPLHIAAMHGGSKTVRVLLQAGAWIDAQDKYGSTPLAQAGSAKKYSAAAELAASHADVNIKDQRGNTMMEVTRPGVDVPLRPLLQPPLLWHFVERVDERWRADMAAFVPPHSLYELVLTLLLDQFGAFLLSTELPADFDSDLELRTQTQQRYLAVTRRLVKDFSPLLNAMAVALYPPGLGAGLLAAIRAAVGEATWAEAAALCVADARHLAPEHTLYGTSLKLAAMATGHVGDIANSTLFRNGYLRALRLPRKPDARAPPDEKKGDHSISAELEPARQPRLLGVSARHRLRHDLQQIEYLQALCEKQGGVLHNYPTAELPPSVLNLTAAQLQLTAERYARILDSIDARRTPPGAGTYGSEINRAVIGERRVALTDGVQLTQSQWDSIAHWHNRFAYISPRGSDPGPERMLGASSAELASADADFYAAEPGITVVDNLLSQRALEDLLEYARASTIFHDTKVGYLGTYWKTGFGSELTSRIVAELREALPLTLCDLKLTEFWFYKYDDELISGIAVHADPAGVSINVWLTPDEASEEPDDSGLIVYRVHAPSSRMRDDDIQRYLDEHAWNNRSVTYKQNRAIIFESELFHRTGMNIKFKPGYTNRRINFTLLFGSHGDGKTCKRQHQAAAAGGDSSGGDGIRRV